jgi:hypothetical protein
MFAGGYNANGSVTFYHPPINVSSESLANAEIFAKYVGSVAAVVNAGAQVATAGAFYKIASAQSEEAQAAMQGKFGTYVCSNNTSSSACSGNGTTTTTNNTSNKWDSTTNTWDTTNNTWNTKNTWNNTTNNTNNNWWTQNNWTTNTWDQQKCVSSSCKQTSLEAPVRSVAFAVIKKDGKTFVQQLTTLKLAA